MTSSDTVISSGGLPQAAGGERKSSGISTFSAQIWLQTLGFIRNTRSLFFTLGFPIVLALLFGMSNNSQKLPIGGTSSTVTYGTWTAVGLSAYVLLMGCFVKVAGDIASQRDSGLLKRIRLKGTSDSAVIGGYVFASLIVGLACVIILLLASLLILGIPAPQNLLGVVIVGVGAAILFASIGVAYSALIPSAESSQMMLLVPALILMFLSGVFEPSWMIPAALRDIAMVFPVGYVADAMRSMWYGLDFVGGTTTGDSLTVGHANGLAILVGPGLWIALAWVAASWIVAIRFFRWDSRKG